jgi:hypothetical protein
MKMSFENPFREAPIARAEAKEGMLLDRVTKQTIEAYSAKILANAKTHANEKKFAMPIEDTVDGQELIEALSRDGRLQGISLALKEYEGKILLRASWDDSPERPRGEVNDFQEKEKSEMRLEEWREQIFSKIKQHKFNLKFAIPLAKTVDSSELVQQLSQDKKLTGLEIGIKMYNGQPALRVSWEYLPRGVGNGSGTWLGTEDPEIAWLRYTEPGTSQKKDAFLHRDVQQALYAN